jgi:putative peptidoglycan lipid II flippase
MATEPALLRQAPESGGRDREWAAVKRATVTVSVMTGLSRLAGLVREILASIYFGTSGRFSAFTIAFQIPNLVRNLVADSALSAAFLPVFAELIEQGRKREAYEFASTLTWVILLFLTAVSALFILTATWIVPLLVGPTFSHSLVTLTIGLARVLFPMVIVLGVNGLFVSILQIHGHFGIGAFAGVAWNLVTIVVLAILRPRFAFADQPYAYAIGVLAGTCVQFLLAAAAMRRIDFRLVYRIKLQQARLRRVLGLMLPVTISLAIFDVDSLLNSTMGSLVSDQAPRAIAAAFQISMVAQGLIAIPVATVLFPTMSRFATLGELGKLRSVIDAGLRRMSVVMIPAAALMAALASPIVRVIYQHGAFTGRSTTLVAEALVWFALSLPFAAAELLLTRTFFAIQRAWVAAAIAAVNVVVDLLVSLALYKPLGISGLVIGTAVASGSMLILQYRRLNRELRLAPDVAAVLHSLTRICAASGVAGAVAWSVAHEGARMLGISLPAEVLTLVAGAGAGVAAYAAGVVVMAVPEARDLMRVIRRSVRSRA